MKCWIPTFNHCQNQSVPSGDCLFLIFEMCGNYNTTNFWKWFHVLHFDKWLFRADCCSAAKKNRTFGNIGCKICEHMPLPCWFFDSIIIGWSDSNSNNWFSCQMPWKHSMGCFCPGISILCWDTWIARTIKAPFCNSHALNRCAPNMFVRLNRGLTLEHFFLSKTVHHTRSAVLHFCSQWCLILRSSYRSFHS